MSDGAEVIPFRPRSLDDDAPVKTKPGIRPRAAAGHCMHPKTEIDPDQRRVHCRDCGEIVSAFDALLLLARGDERWREARDAAEREARLAEGRITDLRAEERRISERIGRMRTNEAELQHRLDRLDAELRAFSP